MPTPVYIVQTGRFLPNAPVTNDDMERLLGQVGAKPSRARRTILRSNGIRQRYYAIDPTTGEPTHTNAVLAAEAVRALRTDPAPCLACGTSIADQIMPGHGVMVQGELGWPACEVVSTAGVCVSGMAALRYAQLAVANGMHERAVAAASELSSAQMQARHFAPEIDARVAALDKHPEIAFEKDFLRWMLSDGAGAALLADTPEAATGPALRLDWLDIVSYAGEMDTCMYAGAVKQPDGRVRGWQQFAAAERDRESVMSVKQDVKLLNENIIHYTAEKPLPGLLARHGTDVKGVDWFLPHYSSAFFRDRLDAGLRAVDCGIPQERWFTNLETRGNTGSASLYIMLDELRRSGELRSGQRLLCYVPESGRFSVAWMHLTVV